MPVSADPNLRAESLLDAVRENPGRHLALGHYKQSPSLVLPDNARDRVLTMGLGRGLDDLHLHGYRDAPSVQVVGNPEPATMILLGSGLIGVVAAIRKRRQSH